MPCPSWGKKHSCPYCNVSFYDMGKPTPNCPFCDAVGLPIGSNGIEVGISKDSARLRQSDHEWIIGRWIEAVSIVADSPWPADRESAHRLISTINAEWRRRQDNCDYFVWPSTDASLGMGSFAINAPNAGLLSCMGYHVGQKGQPRRVRRQMLLQVFSHELPPLNSSGYMDEWCTPRSAGRLRKIAESLAAFARNAKRRNAKTMQHAINDWENDLEYLYNKLYIRKFGTNDIDWPSPSIEWFD